MPERLADRILFTLRFFDLQNTPLTILQLRDFLLNEPEILRKSVNSKFEISQSMNLPPAASAEEIKQVLDSDLAEQTESVAGCYCLKGRREIIADQGQNSVYRQKRERLIRYFIPMLKFIPFVRGVAVGGSHTLGQSKKDSDIDLFVILDPRFLWLGRLLVTGYFQATGHRRHGEKTANRFCLNHYIGGPIEVDHERDLFNAMEYLRLRPVIFPQAIVEFLNMNESWIRKFFPQANIPTVRTQRQPKLQKMLEWLFRNPLGLWLNQVLGSWQMKRIMRGIPAVASSSELSFHSKERKFELLGRFFRT